MDATIWQASKRGFPFNCPLWSIVATAFGGPLLLTLAAFDTNNPYLWTVYLKTLAISVVAFFLTDRLITQFKGALEKNGLSGRDLNKAGKREDKPAV